MRQSRSMENSILKTWRIWDATNWSEEDAQAARAIQKETGILASPEVTHVHDQEYPTSPDGK